ncbi:hypothetical protein LXL04_025806 [Taraxacum kok-saghyz]
MQGKGFCRIYISNKRSGNRSTRALLAPQPFETAKAPLSPAVISRLIICFLLSLISRPGNLKLIPNPLFPVLEEDGTGSHHATSTHTQRRDSGLPESVTGDTGVVTSGDSRTADHSLPVKIPGETMAERQRDAAERRRTYRLTLAGGRSA